MVIVDREVVRVVLEVWKPQIAVLEPFHAGTDRQPTGGEVHGEVQIPAALHQAVVQRTLSAPAVAARFRCGGGRRALRRLLRRDISSGIYALGLDAVDRAEARMEDGAQPAADHCLARAGAQGGQVGLDGRRLVALPGFGARATVSALARWVDQICCIAAVGRRARIAPRDRACPQLQRVF